VTDSGVLLPTLPFRARTGVALFVAITAIAWSLPALGEPVAVSVDATAKHQTWHGSSRSSSSRSTPKSRRRPIAMRW
jgi:hypothetical protein